MQDGHNADGEVGHVGAVVMMRGACHTDRRVKWVMRCHITILANDVMARSRARGDLGCGRV